MTTDPVKTEQLTELNALLDEINKLEKRGNWVEDRKEILKNLTLEEAVAEIMRLQEAHPERLTVKTYI